MICLQNVVMYGSTYVLVAVSIDRLDAIAQPINYLRTGQSPDGSTNRYN